MKVRRRPETIFRVGLLDRQSEVRFCVGFGCLTTQMVRYDSVDGKSFLLLSVLVSWLLQFNSSIFRQRLVPRFTMEIAT
jgi:hypothetical protein